MGGVFGRLKIERTWGVSFKRKGKQWISEYLLNSPIRNCYVLYYFDAALVVSFVDFVTCRFCRFCYFAVLPSLKGRVILKRNNRESFKTGVEISTIKKMELFVSPTGGKIKLWHSI